jgi:hypothetical protein
MLVIVHGWSDSANSFDNIANQLIGAGLNLQIANIRLADYITLNDVVTYADLKVAMDTAWRAQGISTDPRSVDVIVHSTGALITRDWMTSYFEPETNPINRLVMLAPANFGSPLATTGQSLIGRIVKGWNSDQPFQTGTQLLKGLELASPYSWQLAMRDRFDSTRTWYGPGKVLCSVLVGTSGYTGISAIANKPGSDGTVRVSTANLNPLLLMADFSTDPQNPRFSNPPITPNGRTAFLRIAGENHSSIAQGGQQPGTFQQIVAALQVTDDTFDAFATNWDTLSAAARLAAANDEYAQGYQNSVVRLTDNQGQPVTDYLIEAYVPKAADTSVPSNLDDDATQFVQEEVIADAHPYTDDNSYRALLFNCTKLKSELLDNNRYMEVSITAHPQLADKSAGYLTFGYNDIGGILLSSPQMSELFVPDRTLMVNMTIARYQQNIFSFRPPNPPAEQGQ